MLKNQSVATIAAPEFLNIEPYNPLISQCEIKVLYIGENRNGSYITEDVAKQMANSLPGTPIVAAFLEDKDDFGDHGQVITIEDGEVKFHCKTQPYGFVAPDAQVWFKEFIDTDVFGNEVTRKYLMTNGYLWTGQYPEIQKVIDEGMPQSMELDEASLDGHWANNPNSGIEFFIINDATFSKLCILGSDVEPCFEGASVTDKQVSKNFSNEDFMNTLFSMMNELKSALQYSKGGSDMDEATLTEEIAEETAEEAVEEEAVSEFTVEESDAGEVAPTSYEETDDDDNGEGEKEEPEPVHPDHVDKSEDDNDDDKDDDKEDEPVDDNDEDDSATTDDETGEKKTRVNHELEEESIEEKFAALQKEYDDVQAELTALREFKLEIENQQKDDLIAKYHMLSNEARNEISEHKSEYTLAEIEAKLALAFVKENVDFSEVDGKKSEIEAEDAADEPITTFSLDAAVDTQMVSPVLQALRDAKNN